MICNLVFLLPVYTVYSRRMQISPKLPKQVISTWNRTCMEMTCVGGGLRSLTVFNNTFRIQNVYNSENILKTIFPASQNDDKY